MPVYKFTDRNTGKARIVLANNQAQGLRHVAESAFDVSIVRSQQLAAMVTRPGAPTIERAEGYKDTGPETQDLPPEEPSPSGSDAGYRFVMEATRIVPTGDPEDIRE